VGLIEIGSRLGLTVLYTATVSPLAHGRVKPMHISSLAQTATLLAILMPAFLMPDLMSAVRFGIVARNMDLVLNWDYGSLSHGNAADIDATVRRDVEDAITDYLKANMPVNQGGSGTRSRQEIEGTRL